MAGFRLALQRAERICDGVGDRPCQLQDVGLGTTREDDASQPLPSPAATGDLSAQLGKSHRLATLYLDQTCVDRRERICVREDLR